MPAAMAVGPGWRKPKTPDTGMGPARFLLTLPEGTSESIFTASPETVPSPDGRHLAFIARDASGNSHL